jgi:hypothetical protein
LLTGVTGFGPSIVENPMVCTTTSLVVSETVEMMVSVLEPAITPVGVRVVGRPLMNVVVGTFGDASVAGTTE